MKITFKIIVFFLVTFFLFALSGQTNKEFDKELFVEEVSEAVLGGESSDLVEAVSLSLKEMERTSAGNCFECSLYLINSTKPGSPELQLVAADLAVKFSPDLPEARLHLISRLIRYAPFKVGRIASETVEMSKTFFRFPPRNAFFYSILNIISKICIIFIVVYMMIIFLKYPSLIVHRFFHLAGSSKFYAFTLFAVIIASSVILFKSAPNRVLVILTFAVFFSGVALMREKFILYAVFIMLVLAQGGIILTAEKRNTEIDRSKALNHLLGVYSPWSADFDEADITVPGGSMAKAYMSYSQGNYSRSAYYVRKELQKVKEKDIMISLENLAGIALAADGEYKEAAVFLKKAYSESENIHIGYNLAKVLYEGGVTDEATRFEKELLATAGSTTLSYPYILRPPMNLFWKYASGGNTSGSFKTRTRFFLFSLSMLFFYIILLLIRMNYLKGLVLTRCLECGTVMCSRCNAGGQHVCAVCKLMKANPDVFVKGEKTKYEQKRESFFARHSFYTTLFNFILPGGGLLFLNRIMEGSTYLFMTILFATLFIYRESGLVFNIATGGFNILPPFLIAFTAVIYLVSLLRGFIVSRGD